MRRLRYNVALSLDGFIADPDGGYDWIVPDDTIDFAALFAQFDLFVMGRKTYEVTRAQGEENPLAGQDVIVVSRTLSPAEHPAARVVADGVEALIAEFKSQPGKDIWLFGGGVLARTLFDAKLVDTVEVALVPVVLGEGIPIVTPGGRVRLALQSARSLPASGIQMLEYAVEYAA